jgi:PAS domain S-box-containing protein
MSAGRRVARVDPAPGTQDAPIASPNELRYRAATDLLGGYVYEAKFSGPGQPEAHQIIWASDGFKKIFGVTVDEYNREGHWRRFYHPDDYGASHARTAALLRGEAVEAEVRLLRANGEIRWLHVFNRPIIDPVTKAVTGVLGLGHDITQKKVADQSLQKSELVLRSLTSSAPDWLLLLGIDFTVQFLNRDFLGRAPEMLMGKDPSDRFDELQRSRIRDTLRQVVSTGGQARAELHSPPDPESLYLELSGAPVFEGGLISGLAIRISDITERRRTESTLRTHAMILETMREGVIMFDATDTVRFANLAATQLFGYGPDEFVGLDVTRLGIGAHELGIASREYLCTRRDGSSFTGSVIFNGIGVEDQRMIIGVVKDMTERKQLEREVIEISNREQNRIAGDLHDGLGQELTGIALLLRSLTERINQDFPPGKKDAEEVIGLVNQAISNSRLLAQGLSPLNVERGGLPEALTALAARSTKMYGVDVRTSTADAGAVRVDQPAANQLYLIAQEAISNAVRHGGAQRIRIALKVTPKGLLLTISDNGVGLPDPLPEGSGMGLRIMKYRAQMIAGSLDIRRRKSGGTMVECRLPPGGTAQSS